MLFFTGVADGADVRIITDSDVISVSKKITTLEMKELNERQRAEHAVNMYDQQKSILGNLEGRNKELEEKFAEVRKKLNDRYRKFFSLVITKKNWHTHVSCADKM